MLHIIEKYYEKDSELYNILIKHSRSVCNKALKIAYNHPELQADTKFIEEAAMLHDIGIFMTYAPTIKCYGTHNYMEHGYLGAEILRKEGLERHALVCERHTGTGLTAETIIKAGWDIPHYDMMPNSIEEQIICYADLFFSKTRLEEEHKMGYIREKLYQFGIENIKQFNIWTKTFYL